MKKKILIGLCVFFVILLIGGYIFLRSAFFANRIRLMAESMLEKQLKREVSVGKLSGNIFRGVSVSGISIAKDSKLSDGKLLEVEEITADYSLLSLLRWRFAIKSIRIVQPRIWIERNEEGKLNLPEFASNGDKKKKSRFSVLISNIDILSGEVTFDDRKSSLHSVVSGINGGLVGTGGQMDYSGEIRAQKVDVEAPGISKTISNLSSAFQTSEAGVKLSDFQLQLGSSNMQVKAEVLFSELPEISAELRSEFSLGDVSDLVPQLDRLDGTAEIYGQVSGKLPEIAGSCRIDIPVVYVNDMEVRNLKTEVQFTQDTINLTDLSMNLPGGGTEQTSNLALQGLVQLTNGKVSEYNGSIKLDDLDVGSIMTALNKSEAPVSGYLSGEASISGTELQVGRSSLDAEFSMLDTRLKTQSDIELGTVKASLSVKDELIALNVSRGKAALELDGKLGEDGQLDLSTVINGIDLEEITTLLAGSPSIIGEGRMSTEASMKIVDPAFRKSMGLPPVEAEPRPGLVKGIDDLHARVNIDMPDLRVVQVSSSRSQGSSLNIGSIVGILSLVNDRLLIDEIALQRGESNILIAGEVQIKDSPLLDIGLRLDSLKIEDYISLMGDGEIPIAGGLVNGELRVDGQITGINGRGDLSITELSVGGREIDPISVPIEIESSVLTIPDLVISSAGEQISLSCQISPAGDYELNVDSSIIDVSKLAPEELPISGAIQLSLNGAGNIKSPSLDGKLDLKRLGYNGEDLGSGECVFTLRDEKAHVDISLSEQTLIATLDSSIKDPFPFSAIVQLGNMNLEPVLTLAGIGEKVDFRVAGSIDLEGEAANPIDSSMDAILQNVILNAEGYRWTNAHPIRIGLKEGRLRVEQLRMEGSAGQLLVNGGFDLAGPVDLDVAVKNLDLYSISNILALPKPVSGKLDYTLKAGGEISSPSAQMDLNISGVTYEQLDVDNISARIWYKEGKLAVEDLVFKAFDGEARLRASLPLDLDLRNLPTPDQIIEKPIYVSLDAKNLDLSAIPKFAPQVLSSGGEIDNVHLEIAGKPLQPKISGTLSLKDIYLQLESLPAPVEKFNGSLSITNMESQTQEVGVDHEISMNFGWQIEKGRYKAKSSLRVPYWILNSGHPESRENGKPDFQFDMEIQNAQLGSLLKEMGKGQLPPIDGSFSGKLHLDAGYPMSQVSSLKSLNIQDLASSIQNSYVTIDSLNLAMNGHKVENSGQGRISFADHKLEIENLRFLTSAPQAPMQGSIVASGKISMDKTFDLGFKGEHIHPGLFSSLIKIQEGEGSMDLDLSGDLGFDARAKGTLESPNIAFSLIAEDMNIPIPSAKEERRIDRILCRISYASESLNIEEMNIETSGNSVDINGNVPVRISLMPVAVTPLDQSMDLRMLMDNFDLALLSHLTNEIDEVRGIAKADVRVSGSFKDPRLAGEFNLSDMTCRLMIDNSRLIQAEKTEEPLKATRQPLDIEDMNLKVTMVDRQIAMDNVSFQIGGGRYEASGRIEFGKELEPQLFDLTFRTSPARVDPFLRLVNPELAPLVSGEITVDGQLNGDLRELRGKPIVDTLKAISGEMNILEENIKITAAGHIITNPKSISAKFQDGKFDLASLKLIDKTAEGTGPKPAPTSSITALGVWEIGGTKFFDATVDLDMGLVAALMRQPDFMDGWLAFKIQARGQEIECSWPPPNIVHEQGLTVKYATIDRFEGKVVYRNQEIDVEQVRIFAGENQIICKGKVPMNGKDMNLRVDGKLDDMGILPFLNIEITESSGKGSFGVTITGNMKKIMAKDEPVQFAGACRFPDLNVNFGRSYISFERLQADIEFSFGKAVAEPNRGFVALNTLRGKMNDGEFFLNADQTAQAGAEIIWSKESGYRIGELKNLSFTMRNCELLSPGEYSIFLNGDLSLRGRFDAPIVRGDVNVYKGEYTESLEGFIQKLFSSREIGVKAFLEYPLVQDLELDVNVQVPGDMWMRNSIVDVEAKAFAKVRGSLANPIVLAQGSVLEGGTFSYFGRKFNITKGEIVNKAEIDPEYDIAAVTEITDPGSSSLDASGETTEVTIILKGTLREPQAPVFQGPPGMNQRDIIALLTLGTTSDAFLNDPLSASSPVLMNSAKRYLEAQAAERLNLTEFQVQVNPNDYKETRVVVAKQLMEQISVLVGVGYGSLERIGLQYDVSKRVALAGETNLEGDWDVDLKFMLGK